MIKSLRHVPYPIGIPLTIIGAMVLSVGYLGTLLADMIRAAVSHSREYLADACAVQFTRQIDGLRGALEKIAAQGEGAEFSGAGEVAHMLFAETQASPLFSTHPRADLRVLAIDPRGLDAPLPAQPETPDDVLEPIVDRSAPLAFEFTPPAAAPAVVPVAAAQRVARPEPVAVRLAAGGRRLPPPEALELAHKADTAPAAILALLLSADPPARAAQLRLIQSECGESLARAALVASSTIGKLEAGQRMPLVLVSATALKRRPREQLESLKSAIHAAIHADGKVSVFEYALGALVEAQLCDALIPARSDSRLRINSVQDEIVTALAVFAQIGHAAGADAGRAFQRGLARVLPRVAVKYSAPSDWPVRLDAALARLDALAPIAKELVLEGLVATLMHEGAITVDEHELLWAVCARLHCPLPRTA